MVGATLGSYQVIRLLSQGAFGQVFLAQHVLIGRQAAIKVLHPEMSGSRDTVARFFNEARAAATIRHPGLVEVYDYGQPEGGPAFLVMELLQGESLRARLSQGPLPEDLAIHVARQVAAATGAAHAAGIVHRDLKPDNLFLVPDADMPGGVRVKVLDFGIAKLSDSSDVKTRSHVIMGTAAYMAPEQCQSAAGVDRRADVYSLGCILFEMVCGRPPFACESLVQYIAAHLQQAPPSPREFAPALRPAVEGLILRMLAKDPGQRPQSMEEVAGQLEAMARGLPAATVAPLAAVTALPAPAPRRAPRLAIAGALLLGGAAWALLHPKEPALAHLSIQSTPTGADVIRAADGVLLGQTPLVYPVAPAPGQVEFLVRHAGYQDARVSLGADRDREAQVPLAPLPPPRPRPSPAPKPRPSGGEPNIQFHINMPGGVPIPIPGGFHVRHR